MASCLSVERWDVRFNYDRGDGCRVPVFVSLHNEHYALLFIKTGLQRCLSDESVSFSFTQLKLVPLCN